MVERLTVFDRAELAMDVGPNPRNVAVLLTLDGPVPALADVRARMAAAAATYPRLTMRVVRRGLRAPVWERVELDAAAHVRHRFAPDGDTLAVAVDELLRPMDPSRPPWRLTLVDAGATSALVWSCQHVLGDGPSVLAMLLAALADAPPAPWRTPGRRPSQPPATRRGGRVGLAGRSTLVRPVSAGLTVVPVGVDVEQVRSAARAVGATVNDALLWAWGTALRRAEASLGATPAEPVVVSVSVTVPGAAFGNQVGGLRIALPEPVGSPAEQLAAVAESTRRAKQRIRTRTWPLTVRGVALLGRLRLLRPFLEHQRMITTVVTYVPGPPEPIRLVGRLLTSAVPLAPPTGNVTAVLTAASSGSRLHLSVLCAPEAAELAAALARELEDCLAGAG